MTTVLVDVIPKPGMFRDEKAVEIVDVRGVTHEAFVDNCVLVAGENGRFSLKGGLRDKNTATLHFPAGTLNTGVNFVDVPFKR